MTQPETMSIKDLVVELQEMRSNAANLANVLDYMSRTEKAVASQLTDDRMAATVMAYAAAYKDVARWIREDILGEGKE